MEKTKRKELEAELRLAMLQVLKKTDVGSAIKSEKLVNESAKSIAKKFGKSFSDTKKKLAVAKPLAFKPAPAKKKAKKVAKKKQK